MVNRIITELGVYDVTNKGLVLVELADGVTFEDVQRVTPVMVHQKKFGNQRDEQWGNISRPIVHIYLVHIYLLFITQNCHTVTTS